jgi:hypothetical protein
MIIYILFSLFPFFFFFYFFSLINFMPQTPQSSQKVEMRRRCWNAKHDHDSEPLPQPHVTDTQTGRVSTRRRAFIALGLVSSFYIVYSLTIEFTPPIHFTQ